MTPPRSLKELRDEWANDPEWMAAYRAEYPEDVPVALTRERLAAALHITGHQQAEYLILGTEGCAGCSIRASKVLAALDSTTGSDVPSKGSGSTESSGA